MNMQTRFSFNSRAAQENYIEAWDKRDPWRMRKRNVSFAAPKKTAVRSACWPGEGVGGRGDFLGV